MSNRRFIASLSVLPVLLALACSGNPAQKTADDRTPAAEAAPAPEAPAPAPAGAAPARTAPPEVQPPDGVWLADEGGRQYFLEKLEKQEGTYRRIDATHVRTRWGITIEVAKEDGQFFYYKVYRPDALPAPRRPEAPSEEERARIAATYEAATAESDRLRFEPFGKGLPASGQWRNGFAVADMNGDGHLDIVHGPARKALSAPNVFLGDGKGNWRLWREAKYPRLPYDYGDAAAADFNGDGHMDLALGMHLRGLAVLVGDGKGAFSLWNKGLDFAVPGAKGQDAGGFSSRAIEAVDWNGDGRPDLVALGEGPRLNLSSARGEGQPPGGTQSFGAAVYLNQGDGSWLRKDQGTGNDKLFGDALAVADLSGDGRLDLALGSNVMGRRDLVNVGRDDGGWEVVELELARPRSYNRVVEAADFDRDGRSDLAVAYASIEPGTWRTGVDLLLARPGGRWERRVVGAEESREGVFALSSGDLDGDGNRDLVALTGDGRTWIFRGDGKGSFTREKTGVPAFGGGCRGYHAELADLDGDGDDELVSAFAGEASALFAPDLCPSGGGLTAWNASGQGG